MADVIDSELRARPPAVPEHDLGRRGEDLAAKYLTDRGLVLLSRNWRCRDGELDLVATDGRTLVVCEVKTRTSGDYGDPAEYVTPPKMLRVRRATNAWLQRHRVGWCAVRFDVVTVLWPIDAEPVLRHIRGAF
ncbi:MAG TPA: YraN family protein [Pseudonocardiaceae bacterium]|jgi:putative endonuclease|nr:YraN family protein [Pseudonocardiaceae bacterium]